MCVPLGDRGGVVEWVLHTRTYHSILKDTYAAHGTPNALINPGASKPAWDTAYKAAHGKAASDPRALLRWFDAKVKAIPPVMHEWWLATCGPSCLSAAMFVSVGCVVLLSGPLRLPECHRRHLAALLLVPLPCRCRKFLYRQRSTAARCCPRACSKADPSTWLDARSAFTRTTAVWSLAGHMVGLGDRHCDNLLIDLVSGANVQIDFGHLFDSGRELPIPEIVPFRLSQNIVDSFGVCGVQGPFRASCCAGAHPRFLPATRLRWRSACVRVDARDASQPCCATRLPSCDAHPSRRLSQRPRAPAVLHVLRKHQQVIVGLLQAILNDPFCEWTVCGPLGSKTARAAKSRNRRPASGAVNARALVAMAGVHGRIQGVLAGARQKRCRPMTVDAQVDFLLEEAQEADNLSRMFIGWLPFL
jgi:phosphatidylinositol kinase/protein kinase (PI-3  family)